MEIQPFLPDPAGVRCVVVRFDRGIVTVELTATESAIPCPDCDQPSHRVHSRYTRTLADLPWMAGMNKAETNPKTCCDCPRSANSRPGCVKSSGGRRSKMSSNTAMKSPYSAASKNSSRHEIGQFEP